MQRSLFRKYFSVCCSIVLMSIVVLGIIFMVFAAQYFREDKLGALEKNAEYAAELTQNHIVSVNGTYQIVDYNSSLTSSWVPMAKAMNADIYLANLSGDVLLCTHRSNCSHKVYGIDKEIIQQVEENGIYTEVGKMGEIYKSSYYTVGVPMYLTDGRVAGVVFASSSAQGLTDFMSEIFKMFLLSALVMMVVTFALVYIVTGNLVRPLQEMVKATESFAKGDFTVRVPVNERDEIGKLSMAFNNMATSLAQQETVRRSFIANVSHELKTPMTSIAGFIDGILDGTIPPEMYEKYLHIVLNETDRLTKLTNSLLTLNNLNTRGMVLEKTDFDLNTVIRDTAASFEGTCQQKRIAIELVLTGDQLFVIADMGKIQQVLYNLLDNAIKFSHNDSVIKIETTEKNTKVFVSVKDSGIGIPKESLKLIWDRFYKTDLSRGKDKKGTGLGLSITREIIQAHNENINVISTEGEGSEFIFSLPLSAEDDD